MLVRRERPEDVEAVRAVVAAAFRRDDALAGPALPVEVSLLDQLREDAGWLPALSLVALDPDGDTVVGHVLCTRGESAGRPGLGLGPLAVRPDRQRRGVGRALMHAVLGAAEALGEPFVAVLGDIDYYGAFGFRPASDVGLSAPDPAWGDHFRVRILNAGGHAGDGARIEGTFRYAAPFGRL